MPLKIEATNHNMPNPKMSYGDVFIRFEHKFLRNIYPDDKIQQSPQICTLEKYHETSKIYKNLYKSFVHFWFKHELR